MDRKNDFPTLESGEDSDRAASASPEEGECHLELLPIGTELLSYRIEKQLGQGGFGVTYLARDLHLKNLIAIKEYFPHDFAVRGRNRCVRPRSSALAKLFIWGKDRFLMEAQTLAQFRHPNIVRVLSLFEANKTAYMVMDFEDGESLAEMLARSGVIGEEELKGMVEPLLDGLETLHNSGFIHRDIKPENIIIRVDGSPVLIDFGSARGALAVHSRVLTTILTPGYSPLEQYYSSSDSQGPWTDIYAMGAVLYRAVTGKTPPEATLRSAAMLRGRMDPLQPASLAVKNNSHPVFLRAVDSALAVLEKDRPQSVGKWRGSLYPQDDLFLELDQTGPFPLELLEEAPMDRGEEARPSFPERFEAESREQGEVRPLKKILAVHGADGTALDLARIIEADSPGVEVLRADSGGKGLDLAGREPFDLIVLDAVLPDMNGLTFLARASRLRPPPRVLLGAGSECDDDFFYEAVLRRISGLVRGPADPGEAAKALSGVREIIEFESVNGRVLGAAFDAVKRRDKERASRYFDKLIELESQAQPLYDAGMLRLAEGGFESAIPPLAKGAAVSRFVVKAVKGAAEAGKQLEGAEFERGSVQAMESMARHNRLEETKRLFIRILKERGPKPNPFNTLGVLLRRKGDYSGAIHAYGLALTLTPNDPRILYNLARAHASNLDHQSALEHLHRCLALNPELKSAARLYSSISGRIWRADEGLGAPKAGQA